MTSAAGRILEQVSALLSDLEVNENISAKAVFDERAQIIRICLEGSDNVKRAISGLTEALELAYTTAEHHPYWTLLYHASEIAKLVLEKWEYDFTKDQVSEMAWRCDEIKMTLERLQERQK